MMFCWLKRRRSFVNHPVYALTCGIAVAVPKLRNGIGIGREYIVARDAKLV